MRLSKRSFWTTGFVVASGFVFAATGCADDDDDNGSNAGTGGSSSGSGGKAGGAGGKAGSPTGGKAGSNQAGDGNEAGSTDIGSGGVAGEMPVGGAGGYTPVGGAGGETAGGAPGEGGAGGAPAALDCAQYCDWMQASCTTAGNRQYPDDPDDAQCLQSCAAFPTTVGANSFACRVGFAATVSTDATDCDAAGPAGIGECGTPCEAYCNLMLTYCSHEADGATLIACMTECGTVPQNNITTFVYPATGGDTLACRIAHATNAAKDTNPAGAMRLLHCDHAAGDEAPCLDATP